MTMDRIKAYVTRKTKGLGSLAWAIVIVLGVMSVAVYSLAAGPMRDSDDALNKALGSFTGNAKTSQLFVSAQGLDKPASYLASIRTYGWKNREELIIDASVDSVRSLDASGAATTKRSSFSAVLAISEELTGKRVLVAVDPRVADAIPEQGVAKVRLIVKPQGATAALVIDEVIEPTNAVGAAQVAVNMPVPSAVPLHRAPVESATAPSISELSDYHGAPGTTITANGVRFGAAQGASWISCGGVHATVISWSAGRIVFQVPAGMTKAGYIGVVVGGVPSNGIYFEPFDEPVLTSITPKDGAPGSAVTLRGRNFGPAQAGWVTFAGSTATVLSWSDSAIQVLVPRGVTSGYAGVVTHGMTSNGILFAPYGLPLVTSFDRRLMGPGDVVTIHGRGISAQSSMVALGGTLITPRDSGPGWISFEVPDNAHSGYLGVVQRDGRTSNGLWACVAPKMQSLSHWWAAPGSTITLTGRGFSGSSGYQVFIGRARAEVVSWSATQITARVPNVSGPGYVGVGTPAACSNGLSLLVVDPGHVSGVSATNVKAGDQLTISGSGFGSAASYKAALFGGASCSVVSWNDSAVTLIVPASASSGYVGVSSHGACTNGVWVNVRP